MQKSDSRVIDEVFGLANELIRRFGDKDEHECNFALERAEFMSDDDLTYKLPETPHFLEKIGLAEILSDDWAIISPDYWAHKSLGSIGIYMPKQGIERKYSFSNSLRNHKIVVSGFYAISFKIEALKEWLASELETRTGSVSGVAIKVPNGWRWRDETKGVYQFGTLGLFNQGNGTIGKIFHEAMNLFHETPQAISISSLSKRTGVEHAALRSRLHQINAKLKKFNIRFSSDGKGYYRITSAEFVSN